MEPQYELPTEPSPPSVRRSKAPFLFAGIFLLIGLVFVVMIALKSATVSKPTKASDAVALLQAGKVAITSSGFVPATITIKAGDTVTWTNQDSAQHQIATDPYPTEDALASFKAAVPTAQNLTYSYKFTKAGTYTYHDHLNPLKFKATVIVK